MQDPPPVSDLLSELIRFGSAVHQALSADDIDWQWRPAAKQWSLTEVVCHLRDVEREVHLVRFQALAEQDNAFLPGFTPDDWVKQRRYQAQNGRQALADFRVARQKTAELLQDLQDIDAMIWQRRGNHAFFGQTTMHELLHLVVQHDRAHWQQINQLADQL